VFLDLTRRVTLAPPMCLHRRYSFEGIILGFAPGRKRYRRSTISLKATTDRPAVLAWSQRVCLDPERERRGFICHDCDMRRARSAQNFTGTETVTLRYPPSLSSSSRPAAPVSKVPLCDFQHYYPKQAAGHTHKRPSSHESGGSSGRITFLSAVSAPPVTATSIFRSTFIGVFGGSSASHLVARHW
jgi:hypothetical protein